MGELSELLTTVWGRHNYSFLALLKIYSSVGEDKKQITVTIIK
jgi:hypothetical protein